MPARCGGPVISSRANARGATPARGRGGSAGCCPLQRRHDAVLPRAHIQVLPRPCARSERGIGHIMQGSSPERAVSPTRGYQSAAAQAINLAAAAESPSRDRRSRRPERVGIPLAWCQRDGLKRVVRALPGYRCAVVEIRRAVACAECGLYWDAGSQPPRCRDGNHEHRVFEVHRHLDPVALPGGTRLTAASFDQAAPYVRARVPDYGLYLDPRWQPPWDHGHICWPDFGLPTDAGALTGTLRAVLERARSGQDVEVGCLGGHGRTGTALSCLAVLSGYPARDAVAWVRSGYCSKAVETPEQEVFVATLFSS